jgi:hypothetical protein
MLASIKAAGLERFQPGGGGERQTAREKESRLRRVSFI